MGTLHLLHHKIQSPSCALSVRDFLTPSGDGEVQPLQGCFSDDLQRLHGVQPDLREGCRSVWCPSRALGRIAGHSLAC